MQAMNTRKADRPADRRARVAALPPPAEQDVQAIAAFLDHPSFFVRWHVMRELLGLDAAAALPQLKRMAARDPHPEARRAARTVLDRLESAPSEKREAA